jgi:tetratricopeptide (TPR) repeat protein
VNDLWQRLDQRIIQRGGRIDKHIGDAVMALWGVDQAREDDPAKAVQAALEMQAALGEFRKDNQADLGMRIGVHTGYALLGQVATTNEFTAMGDAVNLASRLEHAAPPDGVLISEDTHRHVHGVFETERQPLLDVKGKSEPVQTYLVSQIRPYRFHTTGRGVEGIHTRLIGRQSELDRLQTLYQKTVTRGDSHLLLVIGEPGIGKSRLLFEFLDWAEGQPHQAALTKGWATPETMLQPAGLLHNLLSDHLGIRDADEQEMLRAKFLDGMSALGNPEKAAIIGQLAGFDMGSLSGVMAAINSPSFDEMALAYLGEYIQSLAVAHPLLLVLEDLHWADDRSLELVSKLLASLPPQRMLIVGLARPQLFERHPAWGSDLPNYERIDLRALSEQDSQLLVEEILQQVEHLPETFSQTLVAQADGNPYYLEELIKMLIDQGVIQRGVEGKRPWRVQPEKLAASRVPDTLTGVLQARMDLLSADEKQALQRASIIGRQFWDEAVSFLAENWVESQAERPSDALWPSLCSRDLVYRQAPSTFSGMQEYLFKHALLRDVVYESVLRRLRRIYHRRAAEWLIEVSGARADEYASLIATHYALAEEHSQEAAWQMRAGLYAAAQYAHSDAIRFINRSLELTPPDELYPRFDLLMAREQIYELQGERRLQEADLASLEETAKRLGDSRRQAQVCLRRSQFYHSLGEFEHAQASAEQGFNQAASIQDMLLQGDALTRWAWSQFSCGEYEASLDHLQTALTCLEQSDDDGLLAETLRGLGVVYQAKGDFTTSRQFYMRALEIAGRMGDRWTERRIFNSLGAITQEAGDYTSAREYFVRSLRIAEEIGHRLGQSIVLSNLASLSGELGDYHTAESYIERAMKVTLEIDDRVGELTLTIIRGEIANRRGDYDAGRFYYEQVIELADELGSRSDRAIALSGLGWSEFGNQRYHSAQELYQSSLDLRLELGETELAIDSRSGLAQALHAEGHPDQAIEHVKLIMADLEGNVIEGVALRLNALLTCYKILQANNDVRWKPTLQQAYRELQRQSARLEDLDRATFLKNLPWNREILQEAERLGL